MNIKLINLVLFTFLVTLSLPVIADNNKDLPTKLENAVQSLKKEKQKAQGNTPEAKQLAEIMGLCMEMVGMTAEHKGLQKLPRKTRMEQFGVSILSTVSPPSSSLKGSKIYKEMTENFLSASSGAYLSKQLPR